VGASVCGLLVLVAVMAGSSSAAAPAGGSACPRATAKPGTATASQLRHATLCLINKVRAVQGLPALDLNTDLTRMAKHHTKTMLAEDCLKHKCQGEPALKRRLKKSGYLEGATQWSYAEDLGYESTPKQMVSRWLNTTLDQRNLLNHGYQDVGIGPVLGAADPGVSDSDFVTYTIDLGSRG
jgi:uncharacterized protein YkwD